MVELQRNHREDFAGSLFLRDCEIFANVCLKLYCWSYVVSPGDVVDGGVGGHLALEEHVLPQLHAVTSQAAPEPDPGTRRD